MKKIILYIAASLDQRIEEPDGGLDWTGLLDFQTLKRQTTATKTSWLRSIWLLWVVKLTASY